MYIRLKNNKMSVRLNDFLDKNDIKYFTMIDKSGIKYAILYIYQMILIKTILKKLKI